MLVVRSKTGKGTVKVVVKSKGIKEGVATLVVE